MSMVLDNGVDAGAQVLTPGEEGGAGGRADWGAGVEVSEAHALGRQGIEGRGLDGAPIATDVLHAKIIG